MKATLVGGCLLLIAIIIHGEEIIFKTGKFSVLKRGESVLWSVQNKNGKFGASGLLSVGKEFPSEECESGIFCRQDAQKKIVVTSDDTCLHVSTIALNSDSAGTLQDCIDLGSANWFGGPEQYNQYWPIEKCDFSNYSYVTKSDRNMAVVERYWLNSNGIYIYVDSDVPLFIDQNHKMNNSLCFIAKNDKPYRARPTLSLKYSVCGLNQGDPREAHYDAINRFLKKPTGIPDERMVRHPVWSTWARYKIAVSQEKVLHFADDILKNGFNNSQLEIDDNWEVCYGSMTFDTDPSKFPDMKNLSLTLKNLGFRVTLWIHPFINYDCSPYHSIAKRNNYFVKNDEGSVLSVWWNGMASMIDFTNPEAVEWWVGNLQKLVDNELIDSFKFDAGETSWAPQVPILNASVEEQPGIFTKKYAEACSRFGDVIEVRVGHYTQNLPVIVRMIDKDSRWGLNNGLKTLVTTLLQMNMVGYPFVLPDMIGGNGYNGELPSKELFIRWLQANTFMPTLQFSYVPWDYDEETINISKTFTSLHDNYTDYIMSLARKAVEDGTPINPPIWWIDPTDPIALSIDDEFLLGDTILVAPVLEEGALSRDVYLPRGVWKDNAHNQEGIVGPIWLKDFQAPLNTLPYFTKTGDNSKM